jgi:hypothetical protein
VVIHVYRVGEGDDEGLHVETPRVTIFNHPDSRYCDCAPCLVLGTLPNLTVIELAKIRWFWVEEN